MSKTALIFWSLLIVVASLRVWQSFQIVPPDIGRCEKQTVNGIGTIDEEPNRNETCQILIVYGESLKVASNSYECAIDLLVRLKTKLYPRFSYGDHVAFTGKLLKPANFSDADGRTFDYQNYLAKDDIYFEMKSAAVSAAREIGQGGSSTGPIGSIGSLGHKLTALLYSLKLKFVDVLNRTLGEPQAALAAGLVVGEKAALGKDLINDFRTVGLIHIVVLSGYNITIVAASIRKMLNFMPRVWGITIGWVGLILFGILVGGGATVVRSCLMASIAIVADLIRRDYNVVRALIFAALVMIIQNPMILLHDISFQLSFLATAGLLLLAGPVERRLTFIPETFGIRGIVAATIATQVFVSPFILYTMGQLSVIGAVVNILVLPVIPLTMLFVFLAGSIGMFWLAGAKVVAWVAHLLLSYELFMVERFAKLPFAAVHVGMFSGWWVAGFYLVVACTYPAIMVMARRVQWGRDVDISSLSG